MASDKQIIANRQNARHSTDPRTKSGKRRSRRNAIRHGLTAETVIDILEDPADYRAFERAIKSDYSPQTAIEGQLVTRLASLPWRLRRAVTIESGLLSIQAGIIRDHSAARPTIELNTDRLNIFRQFMRPIDFKSSMHEQQETQEEIGVNAIDRIRARRIIQILRALPRLQTSTAVSLNGWAATRQAYGVKQYKFCCY